MHFHRAQHLLFSLVIAGFLIPSLLLVAPKEARAQGLLSCGSGLIGSLGGAVSGVTGLVVPVSDALTEGSTKAVEFKENCLDSIFFLLARTLLRSMTQSVIQWINTGFNGDPMFVSNPQLFFGTIAKTELNRTIYEIQRAGSAYGRQVVISMVKNRKRYSLDDTVAANQAGQVAFSSYDAGDYPTRLANAAKRNDEAPQGFLARIKALPQTALAAVGGAIAQDFPDDPNSSDNLDTTDATNRDALEGNNPVFP
ncbi:hypothetical protein KW797_04810, partial [Candidatus Parcubacteria bacterium]|nr:hypothetical protein [Candidatus Parcubacteria bacterium]